MKKILEWCGAITAVVFLWFAVLFDPTTTAIGLKIFSIPDFMLGIAEIFGNLIWLWGVVFFVFSILISILIFNEELIEKPIRKNIKEKIKQKDFNITPHTIVGDDGNVMFKTLRWWHTILLFVAIIGSLIAIGSGFWFTGSGWLLCIIVLQVYRKVGIEVAENVIKEEMMKINE